MVATPMQSGVSGHSKGHSPSGILHVAIGAFGAAALLYMALPVAYDGLMNTDRFAVVFVAASGTLLALVGGLTEGLALCVGFRRLATACLCTFALVAVIPPGLMSGRWFASQLEPGSSEALGLAILAWALTVTLEYFVAKSISRTRASGEEGEGS